MGQFQSHRTLENLQSFVQEMMAKGGEGEEAPPVVSDLPELMFRNLQAKQEVMYCDSLPLLLHFACFIAFK